MLFRFAYVFQLRLTGLRLLAICLCGIFLYYCATITEHEAIEIAKKCYFHNGKNPNGTGKAITYFEDLLTSVKQPEYDRGIFFVETKCSDSGMADLRPRYACSVESAAKANPTRDIFIVFSSPVGMLRHDKNWSTTIKTLMEYPNIHFRNVQLRQLCVNTPLDDWIETSALFNSIARYEHASDVIRALIVYRYGGTYMDMDFMMLQHLDAIDRNWIAIQKDNYLNGAVFDFRRSGIGRIVMNEILSDLAENFRPSSWAYNGPLSFQRVMKTICNGSDLANVDRYQCRGAQIYLPSRFYPLYGTDSLKFFNPNETEYVFSKIKGIMGFHFWNSLSKRKNITMGNGSAYDLIAQRYCPRVYAEFNSF